MKEVLVRSVTGIIFVTVIVLGVTLYPQLGIGVFSVFGVIGVFEIYSMSLGINQSNKWSFVILGILVGLVSMLQALHYDQVAYVALAIPALAGVPIVFSRDEDKAVSLGVVGLAIMYVGIPTFVLIDLLVNPLGEVPYLLIMLALIWTNDTMAFVTGKLFGKHKIAPRISPKKSWEGTIGGALFAGGMGLLLSFLFLDEVKIGFFILGMFTGLLAFVGDLLESVLKRNFGVKDSGNVLPGHGGILDRMDATYFSAPLYYLMLQILL